MCWQNWSFWFNGSFTKSTITDGNRERDSAFFESLYCSLVKRYATFLSASRTIGLNIKELFIVDSTTIQLFSSLIFKGVGRDPKDGGKKKVENIGRTTRSIEMQIQKLKESGEIERIGPDKGGNWKVNQG